MARDSQDLSYATNRARLLLGCYRTGDANDPETYVAAISAVLARFPEATITAVTHPVSGLPSRLNWLPTIKEVRAACEAEVYLLEQIRRRDGRIRQQLEARAEANAEQESRLSVDQLKERYGGANWGLSQPERQQPVPAPSWGDVVRTYQADPARFERLFHKDGEQVGEASTWSTS
jgi:hypothetical protein